MRLVQHKKEAFWFYRFLSIFYDHYVNPFFWTIRMRDESMELLELDKPELKVVDVGSGTGFATLGVVKDVNPKNVHCIDQSPHQMAKARKKPALKECHFQLGDAEDLPFEDDTFDRYVSAGSIEYWPEPARGIAESYRVIKEGGIALNIGPIRPKVWYGRAAADAWMLFPEEEEYIQWYKDAGFVNIKKRLVAPNWVNDEKYAIAISGEKPKPGKSPMPLREKKSESVDEPMNWARRWQFFKNIVIGSFAGFWFIPFALVGLIRRRLRDAFAMGKTRVSPIENVV